MTQFDFDESERHMFDHATTGYGAVICGASPDDREAEARRLLDDPLVAVDCRDIESMEDLAETVVLETDYRSEERLEKIPNVGLIELERALGSAEANFLLIEFDAMDSDVQTSIAQCMKGLAEGNAWDEAIAFTCDDGGAVTRAEPDLSMRVRSWSLDR